MWFYSVCFWFVAFVGCLCSYLVFVVLCRYFGCCCLLLFVLGFFLSLFLFSFSSFFLFFLFLFRALLLVFVFLFVFSVFFCVICCFICFVISSFFLFSWGCYGCVLGVYLFI